MVASTMRFIVYAVAVILLAYYVESKPYQHFKLGCHDFQGVVKCRSGSNINPNATITLMEFDAFYDDEVHSQPLIISKNGKTASFRFNACVESDGLFGGNILELYYVFKNVCENGETQIVAPAPGGKNRIHL